MKREIYKALVQERLKRIEGETFGLQNFMAMRKEDIPEYDMLMRVVNDIKDALSDGVVEDYRRQR